MLLKSDPTWPAARAFCGDYAVQQNTVDRSNSMLNEVMDQTFKPAYDLWNPAWYLQQQLEAAVNQFTTERDLKDQTLDDWTRRVFGAVQASSGKGSPLVAQYIPDGNLKILVRPFARQLSEMEPYAQRIAQASDTVIPLAARDGFAQAFADGKDVQARLDKAKKNAKDAQRARAALDPAWDEAYESYHRAVEYQAKGDRGVIKTWIREWPDPS